MIVPALLPLQDCQKERMKGPVSPWPNVWPPPKGSTKGSINSYKPCLLSA